jgi:hypothetical protein
MARRIWFVVALVAFAVAAGTVQADTFNLVGGETLNGELLAASANDAGVQVKIGEGEYRRVPWASFSQEDLKRFVKIPKLETLVEPFIEITPEERLKRTEVPAIKQPPRLEKPPHRSLFGAMLSSGLGALIVLVLYAANLWAGYEVSIFRAQPAALVCGVSAVLPIAGPIIFLSMPTKMPPPTESWEPAPTAAAAAGEAVNPMQATGAEHPSALKLAAAVAAGAEPGQEGQPQADQAKSALPASTSFKRGQFTFNRRFFETKFPGFFGVVRRDADRDMVLLIKSARGEYIGQRITRIAASDLHLQVHKGHASEEVMIPFQDIQEITLKHKDA